MPEGSIGKKSRLQSYKQQDENSSFLKLPDVEGADYLIPLLYEAGLITQTGMGVGPLTWVEINAWLNTTRLKLTVWEKLMLRQMSEAYASEYNQASDKNRPAPFIFVDESIEVDRKQVADKLGSALRSLKK